MTVIDKNRGVLERWWDVRWALIKANIYWLFHPDCRIYKENKWIEKRGSLDPYGYQMLEEVVTYVAIVRGEVIYRTFEVVIEFYGESRFEFYNYQGGNK